MKLNIHILSHPIITYLSNITKHYYLPPNIYKNISRQLGQFLIYESFRNWLTTYQITVKKIDYYHNITMINNQENHIIIIDQYKFSHVFGEIEYIIPTSHIIIIQPKEIIKDQLNTIKNNTKIIIATYKLDIIYITKIIKHLTNDKKINLNQIRICNIYCQNDDLIKISTKYPSLNIYTTQIKENMIS